MKAILLTQSCDPDILRSLLGAHPTCIYELDGARPTRSLGRLKQDAANGLVDALAMTSIISTHVNVAGLLSLLSDLSASGVHIKSLEEPWLRLDGDQGQLIRFLSQTMKAQKRGTIQTALKRAAQQGKRVGRPRVQVSVQDLAEARQSLSLKETAAKFGIGASTAWRILRQHEELQSRTSSENPA